MNAENYDLEKMREAWIKMGDVLDVETQSNDPDNMYEKKTALDKLKDRYRLGCDWSIVGTVLITILFIFIPWINDNYRVSITISFAIVMSSNSYVLYWFWRGLGKINPLTMSITEVSEKANYYKRWHLRYYLIGLVIALLWVGYFAYVVSRSNTGSIESIVTGFIIGGILGFYSLWKDLKNYRNLSE